MGNEKSIEVLGRTFAQRERPGLPYRHPAADWESPFQLGAGARQVTGYIAARYRARTFDGRGWVRNELPWNCLLHVDLDPLFHGVDDGDIDINTRDCKTAEEAVAAALGALKLLGAVAWGGALDKLEGGS